MVYIDIIQLFFILIYFLLFIFFCFDVFFFFFFFFFQAEDGIRDLTVTGVQTCALPICELDGHVAGALADAGRTALRTRLEPLQRRPLVDEDLGDLELVRHELVVVLRVGDGGVEKLQDVTRGRAGRRPQDGTRVVDGLAADVIDDEPRLARGAAHVLGLRAHRDTPLAVARRGNGLALGGRRRLGRATPAAALLCGRLGLRRGVLRRVLRRVVGRVVGRVVRRVVVLGRER